MRRAALLLLVPPMLLGCGSSHHSSDAVRACVDRWNGSIAKRHGLDGIAFGKEANVRIDGNRCVVVLMGDRKRVLTFDSGHPQADGGFLFAGSLDKQDLPASQRTPNADVGSHFKLTLKS
jgi:hypothetical protein